MALYKIWKSELSFIEAIFKIYLDVGEEENMLKVEYDCKSTLKIQFRVVGSASLETSSCIVDTVGTFFYGTGEVSGLLERTGKREFLCGTQMHGVWH